MVTMGNLFVEDRLDYYLGELWRVPYAAHVRMGKLRLRTALCK